MERCLTNKQEELLDEMFSLNAEYKKLSHLQNVMSTLLYKYANLDSMKIVYKFKGTDVETSVGINPEYTKDFINAMFQDMKDKMLKLETELQKFNISKDK